MNMQPETAREKPSVSLILTLLNEGDGLDTLFNAIQQQTLIPDEIVIVDGGSTDQTIHKLQEYQKALPQLVVYIEPGLNIAEGRNVAIERAQGDIIAVTDGGCCPAPDWLEQMAAPFSEPDIDAVAGKIVVDNHTEFERCAGLLSTPKFEEIEAAQTGMFYGRCSAFKRTVWEKTGGYPEWLYTAEDTLFALAARKHGFKAVYTEHAQLLWRPRPDIRKIARMFYLYGRGNGRINWGSLPGTFYWLKYYLALLVSLLLSIQYPTIIIISAALTGYLAVNLIRPNLEFIQDNERLVARLYYFPMIIIVRNFCSNFGFLIGHFEYRVDPIFRRKLENYLAPPEQAG